MSENDIRAIVKAGYENGNYAEIFRKSDVLSQFEKKFLEDLASRIPGKAKILDLGCGTGVPFTRYLAEKGFRITGIDFAHKHIQQAKSNLPEARFISGDFTEVDFREEKFHGITAFYSIFHIPKEEHTSLLRRVASLLEENGIVLMTLGTYVEDNTEEEWCGSSMAWSSYDPAAYKRIFDRVGLNILTDEFEGIPGDPEYHWWVLMKKK